MDENFHSAQRITRLTPVAGVLEMMSANVAPVASAEASLAEALGRVLARDVFASKATPSRQIALRDGFALRADVTADASAYAPIVLPAIPRRFDAGEPLPPDTDAVAPLDFVEIANGTARVIAAVTAGDGVLREAADAAAETALCKAGTRLCASDIAALEACGVAKVSVRRPRIRVTLASQSNGTAQTYDLIGRACEASGAHIVLDRIPLATALDRNDADATIAIGGTGTGRSDTSVQILRQKGDLLAHGIGMSPGETTAFGLMNGRPVLLLPGRVDAALAAWLIVGRTLFSGLVGSAEPAMTRTASLTRKVTSTIGIVDVVLVRNSGDGVEPVASGFWPMQAIAQVDGWISVPAQSEGYDAGARIDVGMLP